MDDASGAARTASEAIRALNHALAAPDGVEGVPDVYRGGGGLTVVTRYKWCCALTDHHPPIGGTQTADNDATGWYPS